MFYAWSLIYNTDDPIYKNSEAYLLLDTYNTVFWGVLEIIIKKHHTLVYLGTLTKGVEYYIEYHKILL